MTDKVWKGTWKPDGTGEWHTKSDEDIVEEYRSARRTIAPEKMLSKAIDEIICLRKENEKLRKEIEDLKSPPNYGTEKIMWDQIHYASIVAQKERENERLREEVETLKKEKL